MELRKLAAIAAMTSLTLSACHMMGDVFERPPFERDPALASAVASPSRTEANTVRDKYRHPYESLSFWGVKPGQTIVEIWPGGGYWMEILAPYAKATGGHYIAALPSAKPIAARYGDKAVYGDIATTVFNRTSGPMVPAGSADIVITARNIHDWVGTPGYTEKAFADWYAALKRGGVLAVEDHRADPRPQLKDASDGYVNTAYIVKLAKAAGFVLESQSEINANPKDTKDHPFGVWTLPPTRQSAPEGKPADPTFDHTKYDAIGESDRMTLRFRKPG
jgi:predicted methyltransferase